jgi:plastocyanin
VATKQQERPSSTRVVPSRRALRVQQRKAQARRRVLTVVCALVIAAFVALAVGVSGSSGTTTTTTAPFVGSTVNLVLGDYSIAGNLTVPAGPVRLQAINQGGIIHNVGVRGHPISGDMRPGKSFTLDVGSLTPGTYQLYCDIPGHVALGMVANLVVT